jgi:hypothetical protein
VFGGKIEGMDEISSQWLQILDALPDSAFTIRFCWQPITYGEGKLCESTAKEVIEKCKNLDDVDLIKYSARISFNLPNEYVEPSRLSGGYNSSVVFRAANLDLLKGDLLQIVQESEESQNEKETPTYFRLLDDGKKILAIENLPEFGAPLQS